MVSAEYRTALTKTNARAILTITVASTQRHCNGNAASKSAAHFVAHLLQGLEQCL